VAKYHRTRFGLHEFSGVSLAVPSKAHAVSLELVEPLLLASSTAAALGQVDRMRIAGIARSHPMQVQLCTDLVNVGP